MGMYVEGGNSGTVMTVGCLGGRCVKSDWMVDRFADEPTGRECMRSRL